MIRVRVRARIGTDDEYGNGGCSWSWWFLNEYNDCSAVGGNRPYGPVISDPFQLHIT